MTPVMLTPERVMEAVPELVRTTAWVAAVALTAVDAKVRDETESVAAGPVVVPGQPLTTLATLSEPRPVALS